MKFKKKYQKTPSGFNFIFKYPVLQGTQCSGLKRLKVSILFITTNKIFRFMVETLARLEPSESTQSSEI